MNTKRFFPDLGLFELANWRCTTVAKSFTLSNFDEGCSFIKEAFETG
jgi:hypothetical protein